MAVSINYENKLLPGRIARACYFITTGTYSNSNAGQDTWNTLITAIQSHSHKKIARVNKDKWKKGLGNPDLPISEIINLILHSSVSKNWHKYQLTSLKSLHNMQVPINPHWAKAKICFPTFIIIIISFTEFMLTSIYFLSSVQNLHEHSEGGFYTRNYLKLYCLRTGVVISYTIE